MCFFCICSFWIFPWKKKKKKKKKLNRVTGHNRSEAFLSCKTLKAQGKNLCCHCCDSQSIHGSASPVPGNWLFRWAINVIRETYHHVVATADIISVRDGRYSGNVTSRHCGRRHNIGTCAGMTYNVRPISENKSAHLWAWRIIFSPLVGFGPCVGVGLSGGTGPVVSFTYTACTNKNLFWSS